MVAFFRQFLVVLLVMLQNAVPLVHAHTGGDFSHTVGIHLYEFESLRLASNNSSVSSAGYGQDAESCIVNVGSAIKTQVADQSCCSVILPIAGQSAPFGCLVSTVIFPLSLADFVVSPRVNHNSSRAPPAFFC
jgi:hypothetical protein